MGLQLTAELLVFRREMSDGGRVTGILKGGCQMGAVLPVIIQEVGCQMRAELSSLSLFQRQGAEWG